jgi:hypothetical protein
VSRQRQRQAFLNDPKSVGIKAAVIKTKDDPSYRHAFAAKLLEMGSNDALAQTFERWAEKHVGKPHVVSHVQAYVANLRKNKATLPSARKG